MITAHLPAGYLVGRATELRLEVGPVLIFAVIGGVAPDFDMLYFYLVDAGTTHHHAYLFHLPLFWIGVCVPAIALTHALGALSWRNALTGFFAAVMLHMVLDSIAAPIFWLRPVADGRIEMIEIPARFDNWIWSFFLHWTILLELAIWLSAIVLFAIRKPPPPAAS